MAAIFKAPEIIAKAPELAQTVAHITEIIEGLNMAIQGGKGLGRFRTNDLSHMLSGSVDPKTSAGMPVLPTPAHHR